MSYIYDQSERFYMYHILYVDDEPGLLEIGKFFLEENRQFIVDTITSASAALSLLDTKIYDAIISDYEMQEMNGIEFLKTIRSSGKTIPFILFTGRGREEVIIQALNEGADFYLQKGGEPVSQFTELAHKIRQAIQQRLAEATIRNHERRETDILNFLPDATFAIDNTGTVIAWNHAMETMTGIKPSEILGKNNYEYSYWLYHERRPMLIDLILAPDDQFERDKYHYTIRDSKMLTAEITVKRLDETSVHIWGKSSRIFDQTGNLTGAIESIRDITERKQADEALRESEERYRRIVETADEGIWQMDVNFETVYVNRRMADMLGYTPEEMMGRSHSFFMAAEDVPDYTLLEKERRQGKSGRYERRYRTKDGRIRWMQVSATPLVDPDGTFRGSFAMYSDITDRKSAEIEITRRNEELHAAYEQLTANEEELRQNYDEMAKSQDLLSRSENKFRRIVETMDEGVWKLDVDFETVYVNRRMADMLGYTPEEMMGRSQISFIAADEVPGQIARIEQYRQGKSGRFECRFVTKDGRIRWMQVSATSSMNPDGTFRGSFAMYSDITDRKSAEIEIVRHNEKLHAAIGQLTATEEKLQRNYDELVTSQDLLIESEKRYRNVVEDQTEFISRFLPGCTHVFVNEAYCRYFGRKRDEIIGHRFQPKIPDDDRERVNTFFASLTPDHPVDTIEHRIIMPDGALRWQQWSDRAIFDPSGAVTEYQSVGRDISEKKATEDALRLANRQLNLFSSITRHDIRNQLMALKGYLEISSKYPDDPVKIAENIKKEMAIARTIEKQIDLTRIFEGLGVKDPVWQPVFPLVKKAMSAFLMINVTIEFDGADIEVLADPMFEKIFTNLLDNSIRHGQRVTCIRVSSHQSGKDRVVVWEDNGTGVADDEKERIFGQGFGKNTGLGLFLIREILSLTGITITETGEPGKGARFEITVPDRQYRFTDPMVPHAAGSSLPTGTGSESGDRSLHPLMVPSGNRGSFR
jgi:PAS domain S-box-containing protein